jgi:hypothetical protein
VRAGSVAALGLCLIAAASVAINTSTSSTPGRRPRPQAHTFDAYAANAALQKLKLARLDSAHAPASRAAHHAVDAVRRAQHKRSHAAIHHSAPDASLTIAHASSSTVRSTASARTTTNSQAPTAPTLTPASYHPSGSTTTSGSSGRSNSPSSGSTARHPSNSVPATGASGALGPIGSPTAKPGKAHMTNLLAYLRQHVLAALALVLSLLSLGGASYAAFRLPPGSVGARELKNRSITAAKLNPTSVAASIRAWATLTWTGVWHVRASSSDIRVTSIALGEVVSWRHTRFARNCMASVTPQENAAGGSALTGSVTTSFDTRSGSLTIFGVASDQMPQQQSVNVLIVCPTAGSQKVNR